MKTLLRSIAILFVFLGAVIVLQSPPRAKADWPCDLDANADASACASNYEQCIANGGTQQQCRYEYNLCLEWSMDAFANCAFINGDSPNPLPVIDEHRAWCKEGCGSGCNELSDPAERFYCRYTCMNWCDETYPKP
jgi:hypothetical protein